MITGFDANGRFVEFIIPSFSELWLHGSADNTSPLPVDLISFNAYCKEDNVLIIWQTASEQNNAFFIVEKSYDGLKWFEVSRVSGAINSNSLLQYTTTDLQQEVQQYYRLIQQDLDGKNLYFNQLKHIAMD